MPQSATLRQLAYLVLSALGAALTWWHNLAWFAEGELADKTLAAFWTDAFASHISASLAWDILILGLAGFVLVWAEAGRTGMSRWWPVAYLVLANAIAAAFAFPLFLFFRERRLQELGGEERR